MKTKRLFIFAAYDVDGVIDATLLHYVRSLTKFGDVIFTMDNDVSDSELSRVRDLPNVISAVAIRHGEYDFGSYKRGFQYACNNNLIEKYDWVYFVNDSVFGPLWDIDPVLRDLESRGVQFTGIIDFEDDSAPVHIQSWFIGMGRKLALEPFVYDFFDSVSHENNKVLIVRKYEMGLSRAILSHDYQMSTLVSNPHGDVCHFMYEKPFDMLKAGVPFVKKNCLENLGGLQYLYSFAPNDLVDCICQNVARTGVYRSDGSKYHNCFRLTIFGIPVFKITRQRIRHCLTIAYKVYLFDKLPVFKVSITHLPKKAQ